MLTPILFIAVIDFIMQNSETGYEFVTYPKKSSRQPARIINDLDFADEISLLESSLNRAQEQLKVCQNCWPED